ncbi:MAG: alkaline phosphatase family protein [Anaerolineae bacterium]|nr:alkaline phosphatase family protein [Anaerolineae bacterium]
MKLPAFFRRSPPRAFVVGLDCAAPELVFDRWRSDLPNLSCLAAAGTWGKLRSCIPAITVPAWSAMLSSRDPGVLGVYGFRNRADTSYSRMVTATSEHVREKRIWDYLSESGKRSVVIGVPQTFPVRPLNGCLISDFLTPGRHSPFSYPPQLKEEVLRIAPDYEFDVKDFRTDDKDRLLTQIYAMTDARFKVVDALLTSEPWDFFMVVEIGVDRIHHGFWSHHDPQHFRHQPGNPYERTIHDYYVHLDHKLGEWLATIPQDTSVLVVSDHGAKRMDGGICINEWLWREGYLALREPPRPGEIITLERLIEREGVDWSRTVAWGSGGYYGRVFLNVQGREPSGVVAPAEYESVRDELARKLASIPDHRGNPIGTRVFKPQEIYQQVNGIAPDLIVYFGDLFWRSVGSLGHGGIHTFSNDTGPDDCNHAEDGLFIWHDPRKPGGGRKVEEAQLMDIAPTLLRALGVSVPRAMQGRALT